MEETYNRTKRIAKYDLVPYWTSLGALGKSRLFETAYFWVIFVPLCANFLTDFQDKISINIFNIQWDFNLALPFSWKIFYFSSVAISIALAIYSIKNPEIIKKYKSAMDFDIDGNSEYQVREYFIKFINQESFGYDLKYRSTLFLQEFTNLGVKAQFKINKCKTKKEIVKIIFLNSVSPEKTKDAFWFTHESFDSASFLSRILCIILFSIGIILLAIVFAQNFIYVWNLTFLN